MTKLCIVIVYYLVMMYFETLYYLISFLVNSHQKKTNLKNNFKGLKRDAEIKKFGKRNAKIWNQKIMNSKRILRLR